MFYRQKKKKKAGVWGQGNHKSWLTLSLLGLEWRGVDMLRQIPGIWQQMLLLILENRRKMKGEADSFLNLNFKKFNYLLFTTKAVVTLRQVRSIITIQSSPMMSFQKDAECDSHPWVSFRLGRKTG